MSHKKKYPSIFGASGLITAAHYMAERIIKRRVDKKGVRIPDRIWQPQFKNNLRYKYWHNAYFGQVTHANNLLKEFDEECLIDAFNSHECQVILSVTNGTLKRVARDKEEVKAIKEAAKEAVTIVTTSTDKVGDIKLKKKKSKLGKLK
jgi:hypothetical protein